MVRGGEANDGSAGLPGSVPANMTRVTPQLAFLITWTILSTFNFGFGTSELNPLQNVLSCPLSGLTKYALVGVASATNDESSGSGGTTSFSELPDCLPLTNTQFGYATAAFTLGGLVGSLGLAPLKAALPVVRRSKQALILSSLLYIAGGIVQSVSPAWTVLALGRFLMGLGSGTALVTVPSYLNDISPPQLRGSIGVLNQLSIVIGILTAQALGVSPLGDRPQPGLRAPWRLVPLLSAVIAAVQLLLAPLAVHAPSDATSPVERGKILRQLWGNARAPSTAATEEEEGLLAEEPDADTNSGTSEGSTQSSRPVSVRDLLAVAAGRRLGVHAGTPVEQSALRRGTLLIIFTQVAQQTSGVNSVLYFSTGILAELFSRSGQGSDGDAVAKRISLGITFANFLMTFPPIPLVQEHRLGRKRLLQISAGTMAAAAAVLGVSLLYQAALPAALSILVFVAGFSMGLGPVPFLILPELVPKKAVPAASSLGIGCNWMANIALASAFLPLKDTLARIDGHNGGSVFFLFVAVDVGIFIGVSRFYSYRGSSA